MTPTTTLRRGIGRWDMVGTLVNGVIGAGILGLPGKVFALLGIYSLVACLAGGVLIGLVGACIAEAGSRFTGTGGPYLYVRTAFGPAAGFMAGWVAVATKLLAFASISNLAVGYAAGIFPGAASGAGRVLAITATTLLLTAPIYLGVRLSSVANNVFTIVKLGLLFGFVVLALGKIAHLHGIAAPLPATLHWAPAMLLMLFGMIGMESAVVSGGEMRDPRRDLPPAILTGILIVVTIYGLILLACMATVPNLAASQKPLFDGANALLGAQAGLIVAGGAICTMLGTLFLILFAGPRLLFAMAEQQQLPSMLAAVHPRFRTPYAAIVLHSLVAWTLAVTSSFLSALAAATITRLILYAAMCAAVIVLRRREFAETDRPLNLPGGIAIAWAGLAACCWVTVQAGQGAAWGVLWALAPGAILGAAYFLIRRRIVINRPVEK
jgi:amino acid transporter